MFSFHSLFSTCSVCAIVQLVKKTQRSLSQVVSLLHFVISRVVQLSDLHPSLIYLAVLFPHNCYPIYSLTS